MVSKYLNVGFVAQSSLLAVVTALVLFCSAIVDGTLFLPGRDVGLLEHPGIWAFLALQFALPIAVMQSVKRLLQARANLRAVGALKMEARIELVAPLADYLNLVDLCGRAVASIVYGFGLIAFVWTTYQNQLPEVIVPFDFWDSERHFFGFWTTRFYKFYLFVWLLPYVALVYIAVLTVGLRLVRAARISGRLKLLPFHPDGVGGLGFLPEVVTRPLVVAVLLGTVPTAAAFYIHRAADATPLLGLTALLLSSGVAYFAPILSLRTDVVKTKSVMINKLRLQQQEIFENLVGSGKRDPKSLKSGQESIESFESLCDAVKRISNYPHLRRLIGVLSVAVLPILSPVIGKLYEDSLPVIQSWLTKP